MLSRTARRRVTEKSGHPGRPSVELVLAIDADYRKKAEAGELQKIAPRRFNPDEKAWLPLMHTTRDGWKFTALFSNTAQAHKLNKTDDWVVIYYEPEQVNANVREQQNTVVTETRGALEGQRVVRGRESETRDYYQKQARTESVPA
jgi:putative hydrolase